MPSTLTVLGSSVTNNSIKITYSAPVDQTSALDPKNYTVYDPPAVGAPTTLSDITKNTTTKWTAAPLSSDGHTVTFNATSAQFNDGDYVLIGIQNIALKASPGASALAVTPTTVSAQVPGTGPTARVTKDVEDAIAYPILTEEIGYRPSPVGIPAGGAGGTKGGAAGNLGQVALSTVSDVLGWKANTADPKGFIGALTQAFNLTEVEGHVESSWVPRTYAVQTDLGGGITGAQASLYLRAKDALDQSLPLLDGLYPLDPEADPEYVKALREMARSQMTEIVKELGVVGLPSILRINTYFEILLGQNPADISPTNPVQFDPDQIQGTLGTLRNEYGIYFQGNPFNNSVEDEADITNFRVISDYMTSMMQSWISNYQFFVIAPGQEAFFGTQLVLISRQFTVIAETVNEARFTLDSVFIGPSERQALLLNFADGSTPPMYLEDIFEEVEKFASDEGPRLLRDGGKISVTNNILPVAQTLADLIAAAHNPANVNQLPDGYRTARVQKSLDDLEDQILALIELITQVEQEVPETEKFTISGLAQGHDNHILTIYGNGFDPEIVVTFHSAVATVIPGANVTFYSAQRVDVDLRSLQKNSESHDITMANPDGQSATLHNAFVWDKSGLSITMDKAVLVTKTAGSPSGRKKRRAGRFAGVKLPSGAIVPASSVRNRTALARLKRQVGGGQMARGLQRFSTPAPQSATVGASAGGPGVTLGAAPVSPELTALKDEVKGLQDSDTKLSNEFGKLSQKFKDFADHSKQDQKNLKTDVDDKFKNVNKMLSNITKMIAQSVKKQGGPKKAANNP